MTTACDMPRVNNRAAANRRASNAAMRRRPRGGLVMPQHRIVLDELHHFISRDSLEVDSLHLRTSTWTLMLFLRRSKTSPFSYLLTTWLGPSITLTAMRSSVDRLLLLQR